jgi:acyl-coenzyme A synthetase/AMP-(fatty) acid ligase
LQVIARDDDLLNIGGNKISPIHLEEVILRATDVTEVGVFSQEAERLQELWVAVVGGAASDAELVQRITRAPTERSTIGRFHVARVPAIRRTPTGKIQRGLLRRLAVRSVE